MIEFDKWTSEVLKLGSRELETETTSPEYRGKNSPVETHLRELWNKQQNGEQLNVLWNTRPSPHLNLLHSIYLEKLKQLQQRGFRATILVFDKYHREINQPTEPERAARWAIRFANKLADYGLDPEKTEILLETDFRQCIDPGELTDVMITLSRGTEYNTVFNPGDYEITDITEALIRNTIEIYYETLLQSDIILSGSMDLRFVWRVLRSEIAEQNLFTEHEEPLILGVPTLEIGEKELSPTESVFISDNMDSDKIEQNLRESDDLRKKIFEYLLLQQHEGSIELNGEKCAEYEHVPELPLDKEIEFFTESIVQLFDQFA
jgi:hypothetical protein